MPENRTIPRTCMQCGTGFASSPKRVNRGGGLYCTSVCQWAAMRDQRNHGSGVVANADGVTASIPLVDRSGNVVAHAVIDAQDSVIVDRGRWHLTPHGYVARSERVDGRKRMVFLHRLILGLVEGDGLQADHINRDRLDNRRLNLRSVTHAQNGQNVIGHHRTSEYRGVSWSRGRQRWVAQIKLNGKARRIGSFTDELDAARAAQEARMKVMTHSVETPVFCGYATGDGHGKKR